MIVHRLDLSTSGLMILAKTKTTHKKLHHQFESRTIKKRYVALLDGKVQGNSGVIDLPIRPDWEDRPRQMVCHENGKPSVTKWEVVDRKEGLTRVNLYPLTGRTHQLRVHCAHQQGLNVSILGDEFYGTRGERLHLHAAELEIVHPRTGELTKFEAEPEF